MHRNNQYGKNISNMNPSMTDSVEWQDWTRTIDRMETLTEWIQKSDPNNGKDIAAWPLNLTPMKHRDEMPKVQQMEPFLLPSKLDESFERPKKQKNHEIKRRQAYLSPEQPSKDSYCLSKPKQPIQHRKMRYLPDDMHASSTIIDAFPIKKTTFDQKQKNDLILEQTKCSTRIESAGKSCDLNDLDVTIQNQPINSFANSPDDVNTTVIQLESTIVASNTCDKIEKAATELRKMHRNRSDDISTQSTMIEFDSMHISSSSKSIFSSIYSTFNS